MSGSGPFRVQSAGRNKLGSALAERESIRFRFDGRTFEGFAGDTLASALLANGTRVLGRSFKFHRPRGVFTCGVEEPNALVQLGSGARTVPSSRSTVVELHEGLEAFSCAGWPGIRFDLLRALDLAPSLWSAGFYNKTFKWPSWHTYEWAIRRMAGFGNAPDDRDPDRYESRNAHCDVLVIGGGVSGLKAADLAAQDGSRVMIAEQGPTFGGRRFWDGSIVRGIPGTSWVLNSVDQLHRRDNVQMLKRATAVGYYDRDVVALVERVPHGQVKRGAPRERYWTVRAKRVIVATGSIEQPLVFSNNDRPGIMLAGAAYEYLRRYAVAIGRRVVVATNNDSAYTLAQELKEAGVEVVAVTDTRREVRSYLAEKMDSLGIRLLRGSIPADTSGFGGISGVTIGRLAADDTNIESAEKLSCDALVISGGWSPTLHLYSQAGGKLVYDETVAGLRAVGSHPIVSVAGSTSGEPDPELVASARASVGSRASPVGDTGRQWVDLRHDVTVADLELAIRENFSSIEHVKRYTTVGMSVDQGKTSNIVALEIVARLRGMKPAELGHTTMRPPFVPVTLGAIVGRATGARFAPSRRTPMHECHVASGALMEDYGEWKRPAAYPRKGESRSEAIRREALAVRKSVGIFDASSLGKIEVHGPNAHEFLDHFYINNLSTLKPGRARYGLMLRESGILFDDGTVVMTSPQDFVITTTSGNAGRVYAWLEEWHQCEWPHLRVAMTLVTDAWATISLSGPKARRILEKVDTDIDLSNEQFPHMGMREGRLLGAHVRMYRVSFTGELTYEINVPADRGQQFWYALLKAGETEGIRPFGVEAMLLLRLEKGFLHIGTDTDGTTVPDDVGWGKVAADKKADFIGKRSLVLPENTRSDRLQLVGLASDAEIIVGSHLRFEGSNEATDGWVTSAGRTLDGGKSIALAALRSGRSRIGSDVTVHDMGRIGRAEVVKPIFYDMAGERMNG